MNNREEKSISEIKAGILKILEEMGVKAEKIILFGSRARGDFSGQSDWDFLIMVRERLAREEKRRIAHLVRKRLAELELDCDVIVRSEAEVEGRKNVIGSVIKSALEEGLTL